MDVGKLSVISTSIACGLVGLLTIHVVLFAILRLWKQGPGLGDAAIYEDADGTSTLESMRRYSAASPKAFSGISCCIGLTIAVVLVLQRSMTRVEDYLNVILWAFVTLQSVLAVVLTTPTRAYGLALHSSLSSLCLIAVLLIQESSWFPQHVDDSKWIVGLRIAQILTALIAIVAGASYPRRPEVFTKDGLPIDREYTVSALSRLSFEWAGPVLGIVSRNSVLELNDLPRPGRETRSADLTESWIKAKRRGRLWKDIFLAHKGAFVVQWIMTAAQGFGNNAPQFALLQILRILEERDAGKAVSSSAWIWAIAFGLFQVLSFCLNSLLLWTSFSKIATPVRAELYSLIFRKTLRRKNVQGDINSKRAAATGGEKKEVIKSTINLIGVDAKRVAGFMSVNNYFLGSTSQLAVSVWLLVEIIGWRALAAGFLSVVLVAPINAYSSKKYAAAQARLMEIRDEKQAILSESLDGIRQIKFSALEGKWQESLDAIRSRELKVLWSVCLAETAMMFCWASSPIILSATALATYSLSNLLTPSVAFTAISVFNGLQVTLAVIPDLITQLIDARVSVRRIQNFLEAAEVDTSERLESPSIVFENASFSFPSDQPLREGDGRFILRNVDLSFPDGQLSVISGKTGSGKSLLLAAIVGEIDLISGCVRVPPAPSAKERHDESAHHENWILPGAVAFVAQTPFIENASIKDNIIFGLPLDEERYALTIQGAALQKDLEILPDGDSTDIGPKGINLSGGQKWRLSFARALYSRAGIMVLDDVFSAVDSHVGRQLLENGLTGELGRNRTRILATHHFALCASNARYLVELGGGTVQFVGSPTELNSHLAHVTTDSEGRGTEPNDQHGIDPTFIIKDDSTEVSVGKSDRNKAPTKKFVETETKEKGRVKARLYGDYLSSSGGWVFWSFAAVIFVSQQGLTLGRSWWLRLWTSANERESVLETSIWNDSTRYGPFDAKFQTFQKQDDIFFWLGGYAGLSLASSIIGALCFFYVFCGSLKASRQLFSRMLSAVLHAPLGWFDVVPVGRIMNRFTADFNVVDSKIGTELSSAGQAFLKLIGVVVAGLMISPYVIIIAVTLAAFSLYFARKYLAGAREARRLESITRSPVLSKFDDAVSGLATIRAFDQQDQYMKAMANLIDDQTSANWHLTLFNRWFSWRISMISTVFSTFVAILIVSAAGISAATSGFALYFALEYNSAIMWTIRIYSSLELDMNAAERIVEYARLKTESQTGITPPAAWPVYGKLEVSNLSISYASDLPNVLNNLSFTVEPRQRVGIVGRTGAGKSSLALALFRFLEAHSGIIRLDDIDISTIRLQDLRSRLTIIPQDPVLFSGTVRSNLDPMEERSDAELIRALKETRLLEESTAALTTDTSMLSDGGAQSANRNHNPFTSLDSPISSGGLNISQGQRQLLSLARAMVSRPKVMLLDEATSAVDMDTDFLIQKSIREQFPESTLLVIAHRLSTVIDFDRILVLDQSTAMEYGTPRELFERGGTFRTMVESSGQRLELEKQILGG